MDVAGQNRSGDKVSRRDGVETLTLPPLSDSAFRSVFLQLATGGTLSFRNAFLKQN